MAASSTPAGVSPSRPAAADPIIDRSVWERLRLAAGKGQLQAEGFKLVDELHRLYPHWVAKW